MPRESYNIQIDEDLDAYIRYYNDGAMSPKVARALADGLDLANALAEPRIKRNRLTGTGPFPVSQNRLGHRSRRLIRSFNSAPARVVEEGQNIRVTASMGSNVSYFGAHEFGWRGTVRVKGHTRRGGVKVRAHDRRVTVPERAMVRTELKDRQTSALYLRHLTASVVESLDPTT